MAEGEDERVKWGAGRGWSGWVAWAVDQGDKDRCQLCERTTRNAKAKLQGQREGWGIGEAVARPGWCRNNLLKTEVVGSA